VVALAGLASTLRPDRRRGLGLGVAAVALGLTQLPSSQELSPAAATVSWVALCALSLAAGWLLAERCDRPEGRESVAVLGAASLVQGLLAIATDAGLTTTLALVTVLYAAVGTLPDRWWQQVRLPLAGRAAAAGVAAATLLAAAASAGHDLGWSAPSVGLTVALVAAALSAVATWRRRRQPDSSVVEGVAALAILPALAACTTQAAFAGWVLAVAGLSVLLSAGVRPERRATWPLGALLCSAATWTWLWVAGVGAPEPYTDPIAVVALYAGWQKRRSDPTTSSTVAYGPGLVGLLLPSLLFALREPGLTRPLLLAGLSTGVVVLGAQHRLRAPLVLGSASLVLTALRLLAPYQALVPRWLEVGTAGALLLALGATYEQRRRDLHQLRARYDALA
jgi:hypothetical protein